MMGGTVIVMMLSVETGVGVGVQALVVVVCTVLGVVGADDPVVVL